MSQAGARHRWIRHHGVKYLRELLHGQAEIFEAHPLALRTAAPQTDIAPDITPDIAIARLPDTRYLQHHPYPEDIYWLIEVADATALTDHVETKGQLYAAAGIREYWVINATSQDLIICKNLQGGDFWTQMTLKIGMIRTTAFPDLAIDVARLLDIPTDD
ncbi:MAG: Uma2 family endonuclease [Cyanobacteria bacterium P01_G01_bin.54]